jgi:hypothetical protein
MKKAVFTYILILFLILYAGCSSGKNSDRIGELQSLPVLWESTILVANPNMPQMKALIPLYDHSDPSLFEVYTDTAEKTEDYIPVSVRAFALQRYENKTREITIKIGDRVSVLDEAKISSGKTLFLVRTRHDTYAWLYAHHIEDEQGNRISSLR